MTEWVKLADDERTPDGAVLRRTMVESGTFTSRTGFVPDTTHSIVFEKVKPPLPTTVGSVIKAVVTDSGADPALFIRRDYDKHPWVHINGNMAYEPEYLSDIEVLFAAPEGLL